MNMKPEYPDRDQEMETRYRHMFEEHNRHHGYEKLGEKMDHQLLDQFFKDHRKQMIGLLMTHPMDV